MGIVASFFLVGAGCISFSGAGANPLGVFRSADKGENWQSINVFPTKDGVKSINNVKVYRVFMDPSDSGALYLATRGQGLFYSYDRGDSWQFVPFFQNKFITGVAIDPTDKCNLYVTDAVNIYKSEDCSRTWRAVYSETGRRVIGLSIDFGNRSNVYAATENGVILQSSNSGNSWRAIKNFNFTLRDITTDPQAAGRIYVASATNGLHRSDDGGRTWVNASENLQNFSEGLYFYRLVLDSGRRDSIYWVSKYGIFHSTNAGQSWSELKLVTSPGSVNIYNFAVNPKNPSEMYFTGTVFGNNVSNSKLYKSTDGGNSWFNRKLPSNAIPISLLLHPDNTSILYIAFTSQQ